MDPISFFGIVLVAAAGVLIARRRSNLKKIRGAQDRFARKQEKNKAIDELAAHSEFKGN